jgi:hypothetical protein
MSVLVNETRESLSDNSMRQWPHTLCWDGQRASCTIHIVWQEVLYLRYDLPFYLSVELANIIQQLPLNPRAMPTLMHDGVPVGQPGRGNSLNPSIESLPKFPDPTILASISDLWYNPGEIHQSQWSRKFNEAMATNTLCQDSTHARGLGVPPMLSTFSLSLTNPPLLSPQGGEPLYLPFTPSSCHFMTWSQGRKSASLPNIPLSILVRRTAHPQHRPQPGPVAAPLMGRWKVAHPLRACSQMNTPLPVRNNFV